MPVPAHSTRYEDASLRRLVVGMGKTGYSLALWLARNGFAFDAVDSRADPPFAEAFRRDFPEHRLQTGGFDGDLMQSAGDVLLSPGVDPAVPQIAAAAARGARVYGDIELFWREARAPILAITGTNAKSTVTTLVGLMSAAAGIRGGCGGNLGVPALDLLDPDAALYVLELSSFQLDVVIDFRADVAAILNIAPDHLDRYHDMAAYAASKQRIFRGCRVAVFNRADPLTRPDTPVGAQISFGLDAPDGNDFGLVTAGDEEWLARGDDLLMPARELALRGRHNLANALAALAIAEAGGIPRSACLGVLRTYRGLPHRCRPVARVGGVEFIDDSKGTNVAAAVAALQGLAPPLPGRVLLIAGGIAKEHDFSALARELRRCARVLLLIGRDASSIAEGVADACPVEHCEDLNVAVQRAAALAQPGDVVLLSPACASLDMFRNYEHRGEAFAAAARALPGAEAILRMQAMRRDAAAAPPRFAQDQTLLALVLVLTAAGIVMMGSASMDFAAEKNGNPFYFLAFHSLYVLIGLAVMWFMTRVPLALWNRAGPVLLVAGLLLLLLVLIPGIGRVRNGATRWMGIGPLNLQPSEVMKFCFVIFFAGHIQRHSREIAEKLGGMIVPVSVMALVAVLLLSEPDFGATVVIGGTAVVMLFIAGAHLLPFFVLIALAGTAGVALAVFSPYRMARIATFLDPWQEKFGDGYQLVQALIAFGRGEVMGVGLGNSVQKLLYLPEAHTDFVFAIIAEELGLIGCVIFIALFSALVARILWIARAAAARQQIFAAQLCLGVALVVAGQVFINIGVNAGLLPTKGLTLPFLSYGGSSLVVLFAMMGLVLRAESEVRNGTSAIAAPWQGWRVRNA